MAFKKYETFPGGSKGAVNRAGEAVRNGQATPEDIETIEEWRAAHAVVLNTFQSMFRMRTRGKDIVVAQRHKRRKTIFNKLRRFEKMKLVRMDDVAGCRLIFPSLEELHKFRLRTHKARVRHKRRNEIDRYDYIKSPKSTGYRGIHDVYEYDVRSKTNANLKGLYVEVQYRTLVQHAWATAVEVIGFITESQPKFEQGDNRYQEAMSLASEILARTQEGMNGPHPEMNGKEVVKRFLQLDKELALLQTLRGLNSADEAVSQNKNAILIFSDSGGLDVQTFPDAPTALRALFHLEETEPDKDIVLVKAESNSEVRLAYKNYFSDARDFIGMIEQGCSELGAEKFAE